MRDHVFVPRPSSVLRVHSLVQNCGLHKSSGAFFAAPPVQIHLRALRGIVLGMTSSTWFPQGSLALCEASSICRLLSSSAILAELLFFASYHIIPLLFILSMSSCCNMPCLSIISSMELLFLKHTCRNMYWDSSLVFTYIAQVTNFRDNVAISFWYVAPCKYIGQCSQYYSNSTSSGV